MGLLTIPASATSKTPDEAINWVQSKLGQTITTGECVALIGAYYSFLGAQPVNGNARDYTWNALPAGWQRLQGVQPQKGDVLIYLSTPDNKENPYGHVSIYESDSVHYGQNENYKRYVTRGNWNYKTGYYYLSYWGVIRPDWGGAPAPVSITWNDSPTHPTQISGTEPSAVLSSRLTVSPLSYAVSQIGISLYNAAGAKIAGASEPAPSDSIYNQQTIIDMWYDPVNELGCPLVAGIRYQYEFFAIINGQQYTSPRYAFTAGGVPASYFVTFEANGGEVSLRSSTVTVGRTYGELPVPIRNGYIFDGWYTAADGGARILADTTVELTGHQTLYAHWTKGLAWPVTGGSLYFDEKTGAIIGCDPNVTEAKVPDTINGVQVTSISSRAFYERGELTCVYLPDGVTSIGEAAFRECAGLTVIQIPKSTTAVSDDAFNGCDGLSDVYYTGSEAQWNAIHTGYFNDPLINANIHFDTDSSLCTIESLEAAENWVHVTISSRGSVNAALFAAAYQTDGKLLTVACQPLQLEAGQEVEASLPLDTLGGSRAAVFLTDSADQSRPLAKPAVLSE